MHERRGPICQIGRIASTHQNDLWAHLNGFIPTTAGLADYHLGVHKLKVGRIRRTEGCVDRTSGNGLRILLHDGQSRPGVFRFDGAVEGDQGDVLRNAQPAFVDGPQGSKRLKIG